MTDKMQNALNHIKTAVDVDEWAVDEVERVFNAIEDIKRDIKKYEADCLLLEDRPICQNCNDTMFGSIYEIIDYHIGGGDK